MGIKRGAGDQGFPWILKFLAIKFVFLVSSGEAEFYHFWLPRKILGKMRYSSRLEKILQTPMAGHTVFLEE